MPERAPNGTHTTSALVRGSAGVGKSTLALSLALAISKAFDGAVYYISTEISPPDLRSKLEALKVGGEQARAFEHAAPGTERVLYEHLLVSHPEAADTTHARGRLAFQRLAEIVESPGFDRVRAVVVDAFGFSGDAVEPQEVAETRAEVSQLILALEARGVSLILVEEAPAPPSDWLSFVVDLVFEVRWQPDPDTGAHLRKLVLSKSRFCRAEPGPHDCGMENGQLAVWPDIAHVPSAVEPQGDLRLWGPGKRRIAGVIFSDPEKSPRPLLLLWRTPWLRAAQCTLGASTSLTSPARGWAGNLSEGPAAALWPLLYDSASFDWVVVEGARWALARERWTPSLFDMLAALGRRWVIVFDAAESVLDRIPLTPMWSPKFGRPSRITHPGALLHAPELRGGAAAALDRLAADLGNRDATYTPTPESIRQWALLHAAFMDEPRALAWYESTVPPAERTETLYATALARADRLPEAEGCLPKAATDWEDRLWHAELHALSPRTSDHERAHQLLDESLKLGGDPAAIQIARQLLPQGPSPAAGRAP